MPTLQQLRYLAAIADHLNFSRAAELCGVAQPTLSMQLKELENRLGAKLVERTRARVVLTPIGQQVARHARAVVAQVEDIREIALRDDPAAPQAALQLGVVQTIGAYALSIAMPELRRSFPNMRVRVREDRRDSLIRQLADGAHDAILLPEEIARPEFICKRLLTEPLQVVLPADHPLAAKECVDPADLGGETVLTMERGHQMHDQIVHLCKEVGAIHARDYEGTTLDTLRQMVAIGMGISLLPALYVRSEVLREQLVVARPLTSCAPVRHVALIWRRHSPREQTYLGVAAALSESLAPWDLDQGNALTKPKDHPAERDN
ncbi:hydrogen peroxide-inducible genes activator [uncultured Paracoccus sp.]|uniref:hydrogen peroxide-inducible genes activator n=1 Tax=uncultured Paracoccus sp. TaxID=189685 RepID=UPI0025F1E0B8|nr:hydrogen peroxide-inducible genes activator [uncultured Paracoccus sp.]